MTKALSCIMCLAAVGVFAVPTAEVDSIVVETGLVKVVYSLSGGAAVVTAEFFVGDEKVPDDQVTRLYGDVCRKVEEGISKSFVWAVGAETAGKKGVFDSGASLSVRLAAWPLGNPPDYMCVDLAATNFVRYYATSSSVPFGVQNAIYKTGKMLFRKIPARNVVWHMGAPLSESGRSVDEPQHRVMLSRDFYLGVYPVTQYQLLVAHGARSGATGTFSNTAESDFYPANAIKYSGVRGTPDTLANNCFVRSFRINTGIEDLDLPTEAQWEFACRAGTTTTYSYGDSASATKMRYNTASQYTCEVGKYPPNGFGLYDMHGHVWEFCRDWYGPYEYDIGKVTVDPKGSASNADDKVVLRGGGYASAAAACRSAKRNSDTRTSNDWALGFRLSAPAVAR